MKFEKEPLVVYDFLCIQTMKNVFVLTVFLLFGLDPSLASEDWLITNTSDLVRFEKTSYGTWVLTNSLVQREFLTSPNFATLDLYSFEKKSSLIRALGPEAVINLDGVVYDIGGLKSTSHFRAYMNRTDAKFVNDVNAFQFAGYSVSKPVAPFPYVPRRGAPANVVWPPPGLSVEFRFVPPKTVPIRHAGVKVSVVYELYQGIPLFSKWIRMIDTSASAARIKAAVLSVEYLSLNQPWAPSSVDAREALTGYGWLYVETDQPHGTSVSWTADGSQSTDYGSFEPVLNCSYSPVVSLPLGNQWFESFRVHELLIGSSDAERSALARHRMFRLLAPHTQENPIFFHMTDSSTAAVKSVIDQMAEVGFEMMIYSFGSDFKIESTNEAYIAQIKDVVQYAHSKGIEIGGYDLISLTRVTPNASWMAVNATTKHSRGSACFASEWYDYLTERLFNFIDKTGNYTGPVTSRSNV